MKRAAILATALVLARSCLAVTVLLSPSKDNTLFQDSGLLSNGAGQFFFAGKTGPNAGGALRRGVIAFDLAGLVPPNATINSVTLTLHVSNANVATPMNFEVHALLANWGEGTSDSGNPGGSGSGATTGDATWTHRLFNTTLWNTPGGDFTSTVSATTAIGAANAFYNFSGAQMASDVQSWLNTPSSNFGWIVLGGETVSNSAKRFDSSENFTPQNRPVLTVNYTPVPEPSAALLVVSGLALLPGRRLRSARR